MALQLLSRLRPAVLEELEGPSAAVLVAAAAPRGVVAAHSGPVLRLVPALLSMPAPTPRVPAPADAVDAEQLPPISLQWPPWRAGGRRWPSARGRRPHPCRPSGTAARVTPAARLRAPPPAAVPLPVGVGVKHHKRYVAVLNGIRCIKHREKMPTSSQNSSTEGMYSGRRGSFPVRPGDGCCCPCCRPGSWACWLRGGWCCGHHCALLLMWSFNGCRHTKYTHMLVRSFQQRKHTVRHRYIRTDCAAGGAG